MKIAVVTDDEKTISAHFGKAKKYIVFTVESGQVVEEEILAKPKHKHDAGHGGNQHQLIEIQEPGQLAPSQKHGDHFVLIESADVILARGMGQGAFTKLNKRDIQVILTDIKMIDDAVNAVIDHTIIHNAKRLHNHGGKAHHH